jgi:ABC-type uncharacterized transport system permease subunit
MAQRPAARSATGRTKSELGWVPWVAVLLLALIAALIWLVIANVDDDDAATLERPAALVDQPTLLAA